MTASERGAATGFSGKRGVLLLNLGTPDKPEPEAVGRYLKQFLMDKWVIDVPTPIRWFLVNVVIVPRRKYASAEAYETVWTERGSPLLFHTRDLAHGVAERLKGEMHVEMGMRYGNPSIRSGLEKLIAGGCDEIRVLPLYPQYAESSTRSSIEESREQAAALGFKGRLEILPAFFENQGFISASADLVREAMSKEKPDHVLFSFHGLPERHVKKTDHSGGKHCLQSKTCCDRIVDANRDCYRAQSFATARRLAEVLGLEDGSWSVSFQSRLGRQPWIKPYTDEVFKELAEKGVKKLMVACPSFTADCLETIEEIGVRGDEQFREEGGEKVIRVPCVNADPKWVDAVVEMVRTGRP